MTRLLKPGAVVLVLSALVALACWRGLTAPPGHDDGGWVMKAYRWPSLGTSPATGYDELLWQTTVPSAYRWYACLVVRCVGVRQLCLSFLRSNASDGRPGPRYVFAPVPPEVRDALRIANLPLYAAMLGILYGVAKTITARVWAGLLVTTCIGLSPRFYDCVAWRIGPDALLCLVCVVALAAWLRYHRQPTTWRLLLVFAACALATATKQNGILLFFGWVAYLLSRYGKPHRFLHLLAGLVGSFALFAVINPIIFRVGPIAFVARSLNTRWYWVQAINTLWGPMSWFEVCSRAFPLWPLLPAAAFPIWACRKEKWFPPVAWWGLTLFLGTWLTVNRPAARYLAPLELGIYVLMLLTASLVFINRPRVAEKTAAHGEPS